MYLGDKPRIYTENATDYTNNGKGYLTDAQTCKAIEKLNGGLELEMQYPISGKGYDAIKINAVIYSPVNPYDAWQPFRIYNISRPQNGIVRINAEHKAYELSGYPCLPNDSYIETAGSASSLMLYLTSEATRTAAALGVPAYTFETDILTSVRWSIESPTDIWSAMTMAARWYNGEWKYDGTVCRLCEKRGEDRHVKVQYGSNLSTMTQDEIDTSYTHIMPYWMDGTTTVYVTGYYIAAPNIETRMQKKVLVLDLSNEFETEPTEQELNDAASVWITENPPKGIEKSLKVTFVPRGQTIEGASLGDIDHVELGDTIDVSSNPLNVNSTLRCISLTYDVLRGIYSNAELGVAKSSLATAAVTTTDKKEVTVWVSTTEPTEGYKSGDYWIKIDNNITRVAQALGRYTGGNWLLLCKYGGTGTGKFLDDAHTSVAHNDVENNTSEGTYDSVDGYHNTITGTSSKANTVTGEYNALTASKDNIVSGNNNTVTASNNCNVSGMYNTVIQCDRSVITGLNGQYNNCFSILAVTNGDMLVNNASRSLLVGDINSPDSGQIYETAIVGYSIKVRGSLSYAAVFGTQHTIVNNAFAAAIFGQNHTIQGNPNSTLVSGASNIVIGDWRSIIAGEENNVQSGSNNAVFGNNNTVTSASGCSVFGGHHQVQNAYYGTLIGQYGELTSGILLAIGNGSSSSPENIFEVDNNGNVTASGTITPSGADYAEYFEWADGNPENEDRRGMLVTLDGDKIIPAHGNDFIGVISATPSVVGNNAEMHWHGKYKTDVFGQVLTDKEGKPMISDEYKKQEYIPRSERPEWGLVGLVGRLVITDDGSCRVGGYVSARRGVGTSCYTGNARVLRRIDETHIEVLLK